MTAGQRARGQVGFNAGAPAATCWLRRARRLDAVRRVVQSKEPAPWRRSAWYTFPGASSARSCPCVLPIAACRVGTRVSGRAATYTVSCQVCASVGMDPRSAVTLIGSHFCRARELTDRQRTLDAFGKRTLVDACEGVCLAAIFWRSFLLRAARAARRVQAARALCALLAARLPGTCARCGPGRVPRGTYLTHLQWRTRTWTGVTVRLLLVPS